MFDLKWNIQIEFSLTIKSHSVNSENSDDHKNCVEQAKRIGNEEFLISHFEFSDDQPSCNQTTPQHDEAWKNNSNDIRQTIKQSSRSQKHKRQQRIPQHRQHTVKLNCAARLHLLLRILTKRWFSNIGVFSQQIDQQKETERTWHVKAVDVAEVQFASQSKKHSEEEHYQDSARHIVVCCCFFNASLSQDSNEFVFNLVKVDAEF